MKRRWLLVGLFLLPSLTLASPIEPGFDLFATRINNTTFIDFKKYNNGPLVYLEGNNGPLMSENLGPTDTIVQRLLGISPFVPPYDVGTVPIQLVALSLKSKQPFGIGFLGFPVGTMADLYVTVNLFKNSGSGNTPYIPCLPQPDTLQPSIGTMTIRHEYSNEGTFNSELNVYADLIFVEHSQSLYGNWLYHMATPTEMTHVVLKGSGNWSHTPLSPDWHNLEYPAGYFYPTIINNHQGAQDGYHEVVPSGRHIDPPGCQYAVKVADEFGSPSTGDPSYINGLKQLKNLFTSSPITLNKNNQLPYRFGTGSLKKTRQRNNNDNSLPKLDATSQAFLTTLEDSLAAFNFTEIIVEMSEDMSRLEIPIITAAENDTPQAWYSVLATQPIAITNPEESLTGLSVKDNGIVSLVFVGHDQQYYESALLPTLDSTIATALMEAVPAAIIEQSLTGEVTFTLGNQVHRVKMDYMVTAIDSNSAPLLVDITDVNGDQKMDYILSAQGKQQIAFGQ